jgi:hypothetical protein
MGTCVYEGLHKPTNNCHNIGNFNQQIYLQTDKHFIPSLFIPLALKIVSSNGQQYSVLLLKTTPANTNKSPFGK